MASRASALLGSLLDRLVPSGRRRSGRSYAWDAPSRWSQAWPPSQRTGESGPAGDQDEAAQTAAERVRVTVVGPVAENSETPVVEGTIEDESSGAADGGDPGGPDGPGDPGGPGGPDHDHLNGLDDPAGAPDHADLAAAAATSGAGARLGAHWPAAVAIVVCGALVLGYIVGHEPIGRWLEGQWVQQAARQFTQAWQGGRLGRVTFDRASVADASPADLSATVATRSAAATAGLTAKADDRPSQVDLVDGPDLAPARSGTDRTATQQARVTWRLDGGRAWSYTTTLALRQRGSRWRVVWSPATLHPALTDSTGLVAERVQPPRAPILGAGNVALVRTGEVHLVTYRKPGWLVRRGDLRTLAGLVGVDADRLVARVGDARTGDVLEVTRLRASAWNAVRNRVRAIRGTGEETVLLPLAPSPTYAHSLLGDALPASGEVADASGGAVLRGDLTGVTGLQRTFDERLRGTAGLRVVREPLPASGALAPRSVRSGEDATTNRVGPDLSAPKPGTPLRLTLEDRVQRAAQAAVDGARGRASLVAVDVSTGEVLAVASNVDEEWDRPLLGAYPPGSTFKVVTAWALTGRGVTASEPLACPASVTVGGNPFRNANRAPGGVHPLARQFAMSCNTAFAGLGSRVPDDALAAAARDLGIGVPARSLGVGAFSGSVPPTRTTANHAAALIGQDRVSVSPLSVAVASATVAGGRYRSPQLVLDVPREDPTTGPVLDPGRLRTIRSLMCEAVRSGTARALRRAPGGPVSGKTGTAQYGDPVPIGAHAWFTGYQGNVAFAVVIEGGGYGAAAAVPVALRFLSDVNGDARARPAASCGPASAAIAADR